MNTAEKRFAAMQVGKPFAVSFPQPDGTSSAFSRFSLMSVYYIQQMLSDIPAIGWDLAKRQIAWMASASPRTWIASASSRVWTVER